MKRKNSGYRAMTMNEPSQFYTVGSKIGKLLKIAIPAVIDIPTLYVGIQYTQEKST